MPSLLVLIPHPDDESYAFAGTIAQATAAGWQCHVVCASSGEAGERHDGGWLSTLAETREAELAASCAIIGAEQPRFWRLPDGAMASCDPPLSRLLDAFINIDPEYVLALGADGAYGHPDHIALYQWLLEAWDILPREARPAILFATFPRGLFLPQYELCRPMLGEPPSPPAAALGADHFDVSFEIGNICDTKLASVAAHRSQLPGGDPYRIFPPGIIDQLLSTERYMYVPGLRTRYRLPGVEFVEV